MSVAVQFWGKENVIRAYEYAGLPSWAIFSQRNILTSFEGDTVGEGAQSLEQFFEMLLGSQSDGMYQLRMYKNPKGDITNSTPYNASFNFRLQEADSDERLGTMGHTWRAVNDRLAKIEERMIEEAEEAEEPEYPSWQQTIGNVLGKPEFQQLIIEKVVGLIRGIFTPRAQPAGATVGSVPEEVLPDANTLYNALPPDQREKMDHAIPVLMAHDPEVGTNLQKIANLLQTNPERYKMFAAML